MELKNVAPDLAAHIELAKTGNVVKIDNPLGPRVGAVFNLLQSRYILLGGSTGSGKTAFADFLTVLGPFDFIKGLESQYDDKYANTPEEEKPPRLHWEVNYFSLERKQMFKKAKWISWFIKMEHDIKISADRILGWADKPLTPELYTLVNSYGELLKELLEHVEIFDGKVSIDTLRKVIQQRARELGVFYYTNDEGLFVDDNPMPLLTFKKDGVVTNSKRGKVVTLHYTHNGQEFALKPFGHKYFLNNPRTIVQFVIDGIGLFGGSDFSKKKSSIDEVSELLAEARDNFGFACLVVNQFNRAIGDTQRQKQHGNDLSPQLEDFEGSSRTSHDADLVLAVFDPYRYKSYDGKGMYGDYSITQGMMSPEGFCRFRSLHVLKNSFGIDGKKFGMLFIGESNHFDILPLLDSPELNNIYSKIAQNTI
jgi:hypothetical protein